MSPKLIFSSLSMITYSLLAIKKKRKNQRCRARARLPENAVDVPTYRSLQAPTAAIASDNVNIPVRQEFLENWIFQNNAK